MRIAPHLVRRLPFVTPTTRSLTRNALTYGLYFRAYDLLAADRNDGLDPLHRLEGSRLLSRSAYLALDAVSDPDVVTGGVRWEDGQMLNGERMTLAFALAAAHHGAVVLSYAAVDEWTMDGTRVVGATLRDVRGSHGSVQARARFVVNATGAAAGPLVAPLFGGRVPPWMPILSLALNLVTRPVVGEVAVGGMARGRLLFLAPWRDVTVAGTSHDPYRPAGGTVRGDGDPLVGPEDVDRLLADLTIAFPRARLTRADIRLVHRGLLPATRVEGDRVTLLKDSLVRDHVTDGRDGLLTVIGTRYTTARHTAERVVDHVLSRLGMAGRPCRTSTTPLPGGDIADVRAFLDAAEHTPAPWTASQAVRLARLYGTAVTRVRAIALERPELAEPLHAGCETVGAEVVHAVRHELATTLADVVFRRTDAGAAGHPGAGFVASAAAIMGGELGWDASRMAAECAEVEARYLVP